MNFGERKALPDGHVKAPKELGPHIRCLLNVSS